MSGDFILKRSGDQYMFNLRAGNYQVVLTSQRYTTKAAAQNGIASVQKNSPDDSRYQRLEAKNGSDYFNLTAVNGEIIGSSQMYKGAVARDKGIESVKTNGSTATVQDQT